MKRYNPKEIEPTWQKYWDDHQTYRADLTSDKPKYIAMSMFNYPSGAGIHIGHAMNYTISDVLARFKRQQGFESYHPVGWDAFGLPAENYAIKAGVSPQQSMATIIPNYHKQYRAMGWSNDWSKEIATHEPIYYKWTQWIFSEMFRNNLAYQDSRMQWWCTKCQTVLANEQIESNGKCWRHDGPDDPVVEQREVKQWFFKITEYADELLDATDDLGWTESVKLAQKNWIGRKSGIEITYHVDNASQPTSVVCFTTRPDTNFGATFVVIAPEHDIAQAIAQGELRATDGPDVRADVAAYLHESQKKTELERQQEGRQKTGVFTGLYVTNPLNNKKLPVWVSDFVLADFGTGAVVGVPGHDVRDFEFATKFDIPIERVVVSEDGDTSPIAKLEQVQEKSGKMINSEFLNGLDIRTATQQMMDHMEQMGMGKRVTNYRLRDWSVSRQRYWGAPIPIIYCNHCKDDAQANAHELHFYDHTNWHNMMDGSKTVETRALNPDEKDRFFGDYKPGDLLKVVFKPTGDTAYFKITARQTYANLDELWARGRDTFAQIWPHSQPATREELTSRYEFTDDYVERINRNGLVAWTVERVTPGVSLVPDSDLPVVLPEIQDYAPTGDGRSALARATEWLKAPCPTCGKMGERETDTLDTYICSSWYMMRYFDPHNDQKIFDSDIVNKWMPIDFYNGADHATAHMIYARFVTRFFHKKGLVSTPEPFKKFLFNGKVTAADGQMFSKSKGNGIDPLDIVEQGYGADALRTYLMFAAPLELWARWDPQGVPGAYRFLSRIWTLVQEFVADKAEAGESNADIRRSIHLTIKKVTEDIDELRYNTAIAAMMQCVNDLYKAKADAGYADKQTWRFALESLAQLVAPFAPHIAEQLWHDLGHEDSIHVGHWPRWDESALQTDTIKIVVQVNGKVRATIDMPVGASQQDAESAALADERIKSYVAGGHKRVIHVPGKLVNIVV